MKKSEKQRAKATAWSWFAKYIKARDCLKFYGSLDHGFCVTCGSVKAPDKLDASHFISREHLATMFDERNVHTACVSCNRFKQGKWPEYFEFMEVQYGIEVIRELMDIRKVDIKFTADSYRYIAKKYIVKYKEIIKDVK